MLPPSGHDVNAPSHPPPPSFLSRPRRPFYILRGLSLFSSLGIDHSAPSRYHLGQLKAKLAKLKRELIAPPAGSQGGGAGAGFDVARTGIASVGFIGVRLSFSKGS